MCLGAPVIRRAPRSLQENCQLQRIRQFQQRDEGGRCATVFEMADVRIARAGSDRERLLRAARARPFLMEQTRCLY